MLKWVGACMKIKASDYAFGVFDECGIDVCFYKKQEWAKVKTKNIKAWEKDMGIGRLKGNDVGITTGLTRKDLKEIIGIIEKAGFKWSGCNGYRQTFDPKKGKELSIKDLEKLGFTYEPNINILIEYEMSIDC